MSSSSFARIDTLNKENYDTWKMQMDALLIKNDAWGYVNGETVKPEVVEGDAASAATVKAWTTGDSKAKSDIILSIHPSELKQIKGCATSREVWLKLESIFQSKGPARKATLLKQLTLQRMDDGDDTREHVRKFFDAKEKLGEMDVEVNPNLLSILLFYSLPTSFENFRCAIESRDTLPAPEDLRTKIIEESDARKNETGAVQNAMFAKKKSKFQKSAAFNKNCDNKVEFKFRCHRCKEFGHEVAECTNRKDERSRQYGKKADDVVLCAIESFVEADEPKALRSENHLLKGTWCFDSGATSHICKDSEDFSELIDYKRGKLNIASDASTEITGREQFCLHRKLPVM